MWDEAKEGGTTRVLVVDDDAGVRFTLREMLKSLSGVEVDEAVDGEDALEKLSARPYELVISDLRMPRMDGMALVRRLSTFPRTPRVIVITAHGSERFAVEAMKAGAYDYFRKPFEVDELLAVVSRALESVRLREENARLSGELNLSRSLVFVSEPMARLAQLVQLAGSRDVTVLITGESGTGKERVADALVRASPRANRPFLRFNCAALTEELAEAELFGHARGAFTGAHRARPGLFREADGGTLLLDEVGELAPTLQARLLRVLQEGEVRPVGEDRPVTVDVRIIAATHRDLRRLALEGAFREDLYYRLNVVQLRVPALRERPEDIPVLARVFLDRFIDRFHTGPLKIPDGFFERLRALPWPGNVRELENTLESLVALSSEGRLDLGQLPSAEPAGADSGSPGASLDPVRPGPQDGAPGAGLKERVEAYERGLVLDALRMAGGNRSEAARRLGIGRATLHDKLRKYGLDDGGEERI
ncbi:MULTISPECIES: sigma-54-dependent transcriptional regulator [Myxococcus]|uniref:Sigma-54-dependent Fis family transcriptional regulator n=1 Tax=Myxococcus xanthus TaxID=34 RepID=A0AAE6G193_MYXXA|nr:MULTISPECIES: sigma-54 dependent transcriptional regulator [Myxococcus]QDE68866.1 sigma-54-dependent Fis family transcriptional regulator [Myxococcus xanthus]QDE76142.1 sigma-54-dependent Fis family transcriptional regulator [Myxococcus xanthus]QDE83564.1 sigma-54-dependent Fis family transcriptional regulator [Myxococcus xanthus]QDE97689.1 sigma-54-dependent Fis family transcriptional regulator [Myxococcus xanthus]QDF05362.1 sigma-54-dependent Fis family transcriptional regulator [Myxococc